MLVFVKFSYKNDIEWLHIEDEDVCKRFFWGFFFWKVGVLFKFVFFCFVFGGDAYLLIGC